MDASKLPSRSVIYKLQAGRDMNALVSVHVMGYKVEGDVVFLDSKPLDYLYLVPDLGGSYLPSQNIADAWDVITKLRDMWTAATDGVDGLDNDFPRPFDDDRFFEHLHRSADRRFPWAVLYMTPLEICRAALLAVKK